MQDRHTKTLVAFVTIFMLAQQLNLPIPDGLMRVFQHKVGIATIMFGSAWAATQDAGACVTAMVLYVISIVLFHTKHIGNVKRNIATARKVLEKTNDKLEPDQYTSPYN